MLLLAITTNWLMYITCIYQSSSFSSHGYCCYAWQVFNSVLFTQFQNGFFSEWQIEEWRRNQRELGRKDCNVQCESKHSRGAKCVQTGGTDTDTQNRGMLFHHVYDNLDRTEEPRKFRSSPLTIPFLLAVLSSSIIWFNAIDTLKHIYNKAVVLQREGCGV